MLKKTKLMTWKGFDQLMKKLKYRKRSVPYVENILQYDLIIINTELKIFELKSISNWYFYIWQTSEASDYQVVPYLFK